MGDFEAITGNRVHVIAVQLVARGETDGVDDAVQAVPLLAQGFEDLGDLLVVGHVAGEAQLGAGAPAGGEFLDAALELVVLVGEGELGAFAVERLEDWLPARTRLPSTSLCAMLEGVAPKTSVITSTSGSSSSSSGSRLRASASRMSPGARTKCWPPRVLKSRVPLRVTTS